MNLSQIVGRVQRTWSQFFNRFRTLLFSNSVIRIIYELLTSTFNHQILNGRRSVLLEAKSFRQARERTYLHYLSASYPCRMRMKEAGWFVVLNKDEELVTVCLYCKKCLKGWNQRHDPFKVHQFFSPNCIFILFGQITYSSSISITKSIPSRHQVKPVLHEMAFLPKRRETFEECSPALPPSLVDVLVDEGLFYNSQTTRVECFCCHGQMLIAQIHNNPVSIHINQCKYAKQKSNYLPPTLCNINPSNKVYQLIEDRSVNNLTFYYLRPNNQTTPAILLSTLVSLSNENGFQYSDQLFKELQPSEKLRQKVNWVTSSDGALKHILKDLADHSEDLTNLLNNDQCLLEETSILSSDSLNDLIFRCKVCLTNNTSRHVVPIKCGHTGLCSRECYTRWMTCVTCGYTIRKAVEIFI